MSDQPYGDVPRPQQPSTPSGSQPQGPQYGVPGGQGVPPSQGVPGGPPPQGSPSGQYGQPPQGGQYNPYQQQPYMTAPIPRSALIAKKINSLLMIFGGMTAIGFLFMLGTLGSVGLYNNNSFLAFLVALGQPIFFIGLLGIAATLIMQTAFSIFKDKDQN